MDKRAGLNRREVMAASAFAGFALTAGQARAQTPAPAVDAGGEPAWRHGVSLMGEPKYKPGFTQLDYVRADAPKGGILRLGQQGTFDNFNLFVAGVKGELETGISALLYDTLMAPADDEVATQYGLIADALRFPADFGWVAYRLDPAARFQDGTPITPADVVFSFDTLKTSSPTYAFYYHNVVSAQATGPREVTFRFSETGNRELPQIVGQLPVLPQAWWTGRGAAGTARNPAETMLEPPLGSGAYRLASFDPGRYAIYELVPDYWARDLPVNRGRKNFGTIRNEYFRDGTVLLEGFKGDRYDYRAENSARNWATGYDFPAVAEGRVLREEFPIRDSGIMQGFAFNLRRSKFADPRLRRAFNLAFDFEDINKTIFYGLYERVGSYFSGTELASSGLPEGEELRILESLRDRVPAAVFTTPYTNPVGGTPEATRANLREAVRLAGAAGFELKGRNLVSKSGEPLRVEILGYDASLERFVLPYRQSLERIGITVDIRLVDPAQYQNRLRAFDFDITTASWPQSLSPGNEQRDFFGSAAADRPGSRNLIGIKDAGIDALIDRIIYAPDRPGLVAATRALDRVLLAHDFVVPQWTSRVTRTARWNRFSHPERLPQYGGSGFPTTWWYDPALAAKTGAPR